jgi:hypothetical protein
MGGIKFDMEVVAARIGGYKSDVLGEDFKEI